MAIAKRKKSLPEDVDANDSPELRSPEDNFQRDQLDPLFRSTNAVIAACDLSALNDKPGDGRETDINLNTGTNINLTYNKDKFQPNYHNSPCAGASTVNNVPVFLNNTSATSSKDHNKPYRIMDPDELSEPMAAENIQTPSRLDQPPELADIYGKVLGILENSKQTVASGYNTQDNNMDLEDVDDHDPDGGVSLIHSPESPLRRGSTASLGLGLTLATTLPPPVPHSNPTTPKSPPFQLPTIHEEPPLSSEMDFTFDNDDDDMPPLEETTPSMPGIWPIFKIEKPFQTRYSPVSPSPLKNSIENTPDLPPRRFSLPGAEEVKGFQNDEIDLTYSDEEAPTKGEEMREKKEEEQEEKSVRVAWDNSNDLIPPDNPYERAFCERVCEEVARAGGFQRVYIKSSVITHFIEHSYSTRRLIFVEPYLVATFIKFLPPPNEPKKPSWSYIYKGGRKIHQRSQEAPKQIVKKTAEIHVGPDYGFPNDDLSDKEEKEMWERWGLWRKAGKEVVEWCWDEDLRPY